MAKINSSTTFAIMLVSFCVLLGDSGSNPSEASTLPENYEGESPDVRAQAVITIVDSDWSTSTLTSDCVSGWGDDAWELKLTDPTQIKNVTITVLDCCCPGDYYEVYVDGNLIGTTPNLAPPWGCDASGPLSSGSFTVTLCPGTHTIAVRDAGFDGHTQSEIQEKQMCPAGFTVSGTLSTYIQAAVATPEEMFIPIQKSTPSNPKAQKLRGQLQEIAPFVVTDENGIQSLLTKAAQDAAVSGNSIALGQRMVALNNRIIIDAIITRDAIEGKKPSVKAKDFTFIEPLFLEVAQQGSPCGDRQNPSPCPARVASGNFFSTEEEVKEHLISLGYHRTANYAGGRSGRDYTLVVSHPDCGTGPFRTQAIIHMQGPCWTYNTQGPEPNPEFLSYMGSWPYMSWPGYVRWWHLVFC